MRCIIKCLFHTIRIIIIATNFTELKSGLKQYLDNVEEYNETLIIKRGKGRGSVILSLDEYNSIMETVHLLKSKPNADRLFESIKQMEKGEAFEKKTHC